MKFRLTVLAVGLMAALAACSTPKPDYVARSVDDLYNTAMDDLAAGNYTKAAQNFEEVDRQHPYSVWATKAQVMTAYAFYQAGKYTDSITACNRFIELHPGSRDVAYAYYLKALDYYIQIADVGRDQQTTQDALNALGEVVRRFPGTKYARDAALKMDLARDHLAGKEMAIGRWYESQGDYLAAINRFKVVIKTYQTTTHVPEALERLTECYLSLGLTDEARRTAAVLGYNYPGSTWYQAAYNLVSDGGTTTTTASAGAGHGWFGWIGSIF